MHKVTSQTRRVCAGRRISACLALAAAAALPTLASAQGTVYTWTGTTSTAWETAGNWTPTTGYPTNAGTAGTAGSGDTAEFNGAAGTNQPTLTVAESIGEVYFLAGSSNWNISSSAPGDTLTLSGGGFTAGVGINDAATTGTNTISANLDFDVSQTWESSGGTLLLSGLITSTGSSAGDNTLTIAGSGTISVTNNNTGFIDSITMSSGTLDLNGNGVLGAYQLTLNGGTELLDNTATATSYRLGTPGGSNSNGAVLFDGGNLTMKGNANSAAVESVGPAYLNYTYSPSNGGTYTANTSFNGYSTIQISPATGAASSASPSLTLASLNRASADGPILFVNGTGLGTAGSGYGQIYVSSTSGLNLSGAGQTGTTDNPAIQDAEIVPYLVGEVPVTTGAVGSQTGTPDTFVAYTTSGSLRPLNPVDEFSDNAIVGGDNIYITPTGATASSSNSINSIVFNGGNLAISSGTTLTNASGALLYVTSNGVTPGSAGTMAFGSNEIVATVNSGMTGTLGTITGTGNLNLTGSGILDLTGVSPSFTGNVYINSNTLQFGNRTSGDDGNLPNAGNIYFANLSGNSALAIENTTNQTISAAIQAPSNGNVMNIYDVGLGGINFNGNLVLNSGVGEPFVWLYGGNGAGPINFNGSITQSGAGNIGSIYIEVATNGGVTFNDTDASAYLRLYMQSVPTANLYGTYTPPLVNGAIPNMSVTLSTSGSIGSLFNGTGASATPTSPSTNSGIYFTNLNRSATATTATSPVYFFQNGPVNGSGTTSSSQTTYDGYWSGTAVWYVNNDLAASASLEIEYNSHGEGTTPNVGAMYVAPNELVTVAPFSANTQNGAFVVGYGNYSTDISGDYGYLSVGAGSNVYDNGTGNSFYAGLESNAQVDMLNSTATSPSTLGIYDRLYIDSGGFSGVQDTVNIGTNDVMTVGNFNGNGTVAGGLTASDSIAMNALNSVYATAVLSINGGTVNNVNSSKSFSSGNTNVYISLFGTGANDNVSVTNLSPGVVNLGSYSSSSAGGTLRTGYVKAETISATISGTKYYGDNSTYLNFNGGELDYNGTNSLQSPQGTFIQYNLNSAFVNQGGATIGTTYTNSGYTGNTVASTLPLLAPPGSGIYQITVTNSGSGYVAPPQVEITDAQGFDASAYAVIDSVYGDPNYGKITNIIVTNPGFNMTDPTITILGGGGSGATATASIQANNSYLGIADFSTTSLGGVTKTESGMLQLVGTYEGTNSTDTSISSFTTSGTSAQVITGVAAAGAPTGANLGNDPAVGSGNAANYIRNNTSTYTGPTVINNGTLALITAKSASVTGAGTVTTFPATNNNIPYSSMIIVGDVPTFVSGAPTSTSVLQVYGATGYTSPNYTSSGIGGTGGFELAPVLSSGSGQQIGQILAGFGTILGGSSVPLSIGYNPTGNNFGQASSTIYASNNSMIAPGYTPNTGTNAGGQTMGTTYLGYPFSTAQGGSAGATTPQTGVLTITGSLPAALSQTGAAQTNGAMVTNLGAGGEYYWKVNLATASGGATSTPGTQGIQNSSSTLSSANAAVNGAAWDALVMDSVNATGSPFVIQAVGFGTQSASGVQIGSSYTQDYSWVIAHASDASISTSLLANLALNPSGMPAPAAGYGYYLTADNDPMAGTDLVVNYAPVPEPTALALLAPAAGAMLLRRRRRTAAKLA